MPIPQSFVRGSHGLFMRSSHGVRGGFTGCPADILATFAGVNAGVCTSLCSTVVGKSWRPVSLGVDGSYADTATAVGGVCRAVRHFLFAEATTLLTSNLYNGIVCAGAPDPYTPSDADLYLEFNSTSGYITQCWFLVRISPVGSPSPTVNYAMFYFNDPASTYQFGDAIPNMSEDCDLMPDFTGFGFLFHNHYAASTTGTVTITQA